MTVDITQDTQDCIWIFNADKHLCSLQTAHLPRDAVNVVYVVGLLRPCAILCEIISRDHLEQYYSAIEKLSQSQKV